MQGVRFFRSGEKAGDDSDHPLRLSIVSGAQCKDVPLVYSDLSLMQWQIGIAAQIEIAKWHEGHPNWRVAKYRCQMPGTFAKHQR
jgi:hypothetical protein